MAAIKIELVNVLKREGLKTLNLSHNPAKRLDCWRVRRLIISIDAAITISWTETSQWSRALSKGWKKRGWSQNKHIPIQIKWTNSHELCSKYWVKLGLNNRINNFYFVNLKDDYKINKKGKNKMNICMLNKNKNEN